MDLKLKGIGALADMSIRIDGLTVILGANGTGKSTVLKSLYTIASSTVDLRTKKLDEALSSLDILLSQRSGGPTDRWMAAKIRISGLLSTGDSEQAAHVMKVAISGLPTDDTEIGHTAPLLLRMIDGEADEELIDAIAERTLRAEFSGIRQARRMTSDEPASITLSDGDGPRTIGITTEDRCQWTGRTEGLFPSAMLCDSPFILDGAYYTSGADHCGDLGDKLFHRTRYQVRAENADMKRIRGMLRSAIGGGVIASKKGFEYVTDDGIRLGVSNLGAGSKLFAMLDVLIRNGDVGPGSLVLLDAPESHVDAARLDTVARVIVLLARDLGAKVVMTTQSPLLLLAVRDASQEYGQDADCYSLERSSSGLSSVRDLHGDLGSACRAMKCAVPEGRFS